MKTEIKIDNEFQTLIDAAYRISEDVGEEVNAILAAGRKAPLTMPEAGQLLTKVLTVLKTSAERRNDQRTVKALAGDVNELIKRIGLSTESAVAPTGNGSTPAKLDLQG